MTTETRKHRNRSHRRAGEARGRHCAMSRSGKSKRPKTLPPTTRVDAIAGGPGQHPELKEAKKASRYERLKRARDQYKAEAEELRPRLGQSAEQRESYSETDSDTWHQSQGRRRRSAPLERSLEAAQHMHGDAFDKAYEAFVEYAHETRDKAAYERVMQSADPGAELVQWWNEQGNPSPSPEASKPRCSRAGNNRNFSSSSQPEMSRSVCKRN